MVYFIMGACSGIAVCIFVWNISKRAGGHNESGIDDAIKREGILNKRIEELQGELLIARSELQESRHEIHGARQEIRNVTARLSQVENRVSDTDGLVDDLKKRNSP